MSTNNRLSFGDKLRLGFGYIKPGEEKNNKLFFTNIFITASLATIVGVLFTCYNRRNTDDKYQDRDLLAMSITAAVILGLFIIPLNFFDGLNVFRYGYYQSTRHTIYTTIIVISLILLIFVISYYSTIGHHQHDQKNYLITAMVFLGLVIIFSWFMYHVSNNPYGNLAKLFNIEVLSDDELYAINSDLFAEYNKQKELSRLLEEYMGGDNSGINKNVTKITDVDLKKIINSGKNYDNLSISEKGIITALANQSYIVSVETKKSLYNLGEFKTKYNQIISSVTSLNIDKDKDQKELIAEKVLKLTKSKNYFYKVPLPAKQLIELNRAIESSRDGRITAEQYNKIFGYYDNTTGLINIGVFDNIREIKDKYKKIEEETEKNREENVKNKEEIQNLLKAQLSDNIVGKLKTLFNKSSNYTRGSRAQMIEIDKISDTIVNNIDNHLKNISLKNDNNINERIAKNYVNKIINSEACDFTNELAYTRDIDYTFAKTQLDKLAKCTKDNKITI